jgi:6-phosphofructokinase
MKVGILNSGGDVQGINAVISAIYYAAKHAGLDYQLVGFIKGWEGILDKEYIEITEEKVQGISKWGGTILHSVNKGRFSGKVGEGQVNEIPAEILEETRHNLEELEIQALIVIGGDGTLTASLQLAELGVPIVGVPKTIDNDLGSTEQTFGFSTAVAIGMEAIDRIQTTALSHERVIFVETMGRHVGWIGLYAGVAGEADAILLPEFGFSYQGLIKFLRERMAKQPRYAIVIVAEGVMAHDEPPREVVAAGAEMRMAGRSVEIMNNIEKMAPGEFEMRNVVLGHTQRGGTPNAEDRILAKAYGTAAINAVKHQKFGHMVCLRGSDVVTVPITEAVSSLNRVTKDTLAYQTAEALGVYLGE